MQNSKASRRFPWLTLALVLGSVAGWQLGDAIGLHGKRWFVEPEFIFEILVALSGALCGALLSYASERGPLWRALGVLAGACFIVAVLGYCRHRLGVPSADMGLLTYARQFILQTFGIWMSPVIGAALVSLLRVILR
ncbi:hypothetical protein N7414_10340 [Pseudomonas sp. GD04087]|uniref:hypothetical protein n=1 Tax=Pseudomonas TaxID=286 RepID=UPI001F3DAD71|nr:MULTISPECIES: hypothetical protein [Pseudomonas]MDH0289509.1 hypothetical protein [Pseudomonas sp. GD04087]MDH1050995.1 hypothetical protein [Pseudomonas sp. GD03903]MDH1999264.1 hypothetical protein [Pseudomonas sp. GD03691]